MFHGIPQTAFDSSCAKLIDAIQTIFMLPYFTWAGELIMSTLLLVSETIVVRLFCSLLSTTDVCTLQTPLWVIAGCICLPVVFSFDRSQFCEQCRGFLYAYTLTHLISRHVIAGWAPLQSLCLVVSKRSRLPRRSRKRECSGSGDSGEHSKANTTKQLFVPLTPDLVMWYPLTAP